MADLGYETDLMLVGHGGSVVRRDGYVRAIWPSLPHYYWGNLLVLDAPPVPDSVARWVDTFASEYSHLPRVRHVALGWRGDGAGREDPLVATEAERAALGALAAAGFVTIDCMVLVATSLPPPEAAAPSVAVTRPLRTDDDWEQDVEVQMEAVVPNIRRDVFEAFIRDRAAAHRELCDRGVATFFGAFLPSGELAGSLGVVVGPGGVGRYQTVAVRERHRRQGIAQRMVVDAGRYATATMGATTLVIVADADDAPERIYRRAGFERVIRQVGAFRRPLASEAEPAAT